MKKLALISCVFVLAALLGLATACNSGPKPPIIPTTPLTFTTPGGGTSSTSPTTVSTVTSTSNSTSGTKTETSTTTSTGTSSTTSTLRALPQPANHITGHLSCLSCHLNGREGAPIVPADHAGLTNSVCAGCHLPP